MSVLVIAGSKGGPGKTTVARALCAALAREGTAFCAVDADPTKALHRWAGSIYEGPGFQCFAEPNEDRLAHLLAEIRETYPLVLVDTPGFSNQASSVAIASADAVLVPCRCSEPDLFEARTTALRVRALSLTSRRDIPVRVVLNGVRGTKVAQHAAAQIAEIGLERLQTTLGHREAYETITHSGVAPTTGDAWRETDRLVEELRAMAWLPRLRAQAAARGAA